MEIGDKVKALDSGQISTLSARKMHKEETGIISRLEGNIIYLIADIDQVILCRNIAHLTVIEKAGIVKNNYQIY